MTCIIAWKFDSSRHGMDSMPVTTRQLEALIRLAEVEFFFCIQMQICIQMQTTKSTDPL